jgi:hypothetical protein
MADRNARLDTADTSTCNGVEMATVKKQLVMPEEYDKFIRQAAEEESIDQSQIVRKALDLFMIARQKRKQGFKIGAARPDQELVTEITGI